MKQRIVWIDTAKAFAILAIVMGHVLRGGTFQGYLLSFHVPLFFMLSGCVFSVRKERNFGSFLKKKIYTILVPYFLWGLISVVIFQFFGEMAGQSLGVDTARDSNPLLSVLALLYGNTTVLSLKANLPLWFLPCLFAAQLLFYAVDKYISQNKGLMVAVTAALFVAAGINQNILHIWRLPFNAENALFMSGYFALGMCLRYTKRYAKQDGILWHELAAGILLTVAGAFAAVHNTHIAYSWSIYGNYTYFMFSSLCGCLGWILILRQVRAFGFVRLVGGSTLSILVMHKFPIVFFQTMVPVVKDWLAADSVPAAAGISIIVILMCLGVQYILLRIAPVFVGKRKNS